MAPVQACRGFYKNLYGEVIIYQQTAIHSLAKSMSD